MMAVERETDRQGRRVRQHGAVGNWHELWSESKRSGRVFGENALIDLPGDLTWIRSLTDGSGSLAATQTPRSDADCELGERATDSIVPRRSTVRQ
jgi:hypothetical protein